MSELLHRLPPMVQAKMLVIPVKNIDSEIFKQQTHEGFGEEIQVNIDKNNKENQWRIGIGYKLEDKIKKQSKEKKIQMQD